MVDARLPASSGPADPAAPDDSASGGLERVLTIRNRRGLHARASARFVQTAERFDAELTISRDGLSGGGQSIMGLMMLAAGQGATIAVRASGRDAEAALQAITDLVEDGFGEEC